MTRSNTTRLGNRAPVVDSIYIKRIGRRKSWLILVQTLIALFLLAFASYVQKALYTASTKGDIIILTLIFFTMTFLVSVQDIAVDGWALTMLSKYSKTLHKHFAYLQLFTKLKFEGKTCHSSRLATRLVKLSASLSLRAS